MRHALKAATAAFLLFPQFAAADSMQTVHCQLDWMGSEHCRAKPLIYGQPRVRVYGYLARPRRVRPSDEDRYVRPQKVREDRGEYALSPAPGREAICRASVSVVGSQGITTDAALASARKGWAEQVRFQFGEMFMDIELAQSLASRCSRSSIGELAGQTMHRCQLEARPCRSEMKAGDRD